MLMISEPSILKSLVKDPRWIALAGVVGAAVLLIVLLRELLVPILLAFILAYSLNDGVTRLCQVCRRSLAVPLVFLGFLVVYLTLLIGPIQLAVRQIMNLVVSFPDISKRFQQLLAEIQIPPALYTFLRVRSQQVWELLSSNMEGSLQSLLAHMAVTVTGITTLTFYLFLIPLLVFFLLQDKVNLETMFLRVLPRRRELLERVWDKMEPRMGQYVRGKLWEILVVSATTGLAFYLLGFHYVAVTSLAAGLSVLIPYVGAVVVTVPIFLLGLIQWGFDASLLWLMVAHGLIQFLDGNVLVPLLFSDAMKLPPTVILLATLFFGAIWGLWGIFFAIPLATLLKSLVEEYLDYRDSTEPADAP